MFERLALKKEILAMIENGLCSKESGMKASACIRFLEDDEIESLKTYEAVDLAFEISKTKTHQQIFGANFLKIGDRVELRGNIGKVIEVSDKSLTIYCGDRKGRVPYTLGVSKKVFGREGQIL
jgi:hypothetical protein